MTADFIEQADLPTVYRRYTAFVDGRAVVVEGVPYIHDPETDDFFLEADVAERLYQIVRNPVLRSTIGRADLYAWADADIRLADLTLRFTGPGYEYGYTPVSLFARAADRVRETSLSIRAELIKNQRQQTTQKTKKFGTPHNSEPQVRYVGAGSLIVALDAPQTSLMPEDVIEEKLARESMEILVDAAAWVASPDESEIPPRLEDPKIRAVALQAVERLLPSAKEKDAAVELGGELISANKNPNFSDVIALHHDLKPVVQDKFLSAVAELQQGDAVVLTGVLDSLSRKGRVKITGLDWETKTLEGRVSMDDQALINRVSQYWAQEALVEVRGVVVRKPDGSPRRIDIHYIDAAPQID